MNSMLNSLRIRVQDAFVAYCRTAKGVEEHKARAALKRSRRAYKRQRDYDRCINGNYPALRAAHATALAAFQQPSRTPKPMRYCGEKKKLQGEYALVRYFNEHGYIEAQFDNLELTWKGARLSQGWHRFQLSEFEVA